MRTVLLLGLLLASAFAGCLGDEGDDTPMDEPDAPATPQRTSADVTFSDSGLIVGAVEDPTTTCGGPSPMGTLRLTWTIEAPEGATSVRVSDLSFTATYPITMPEGDIYVFDPDGQLITDSTGAALPPADPTAITDTVTASGNHPAGDYTIEVRGCAGAGEVSLDASGVLSYLPT